MSIEEIDPSEVLKIFERHTPNNHLIDVREIEEFNEISTPFSKNYPLSSLDMHQVLNDLGIDANDQKTTLYFICRSGNRSGKAAELFSQNGFKNVINVKGGMMLWNSLGLTTQP